MKNLTLRVDEAVLAAARRKAADEGATLGCVVRDFLSRFADMEDAASRQARRDLAALAREADWRPGADWKWDRDAAYDERISGHERSSLRGD